jgi:nucleoside-diphosphate-sugar epimerase
MVQRVLLTGANGYLGSHILEQLLSKGFFVRSVVRSQAKAGQILQDFPNYTSQMDFGIVPDMTVSGAFNDVVKSTPPFDTVIHTASPFHRDVSHPEGFLEPAIKGTTEMLQAVKTNAPEVRRLIYTSSCAAVMDFNAPIGTTPPRVYTEEDWNPVTHKEALSDIKNVFTAYRASKKYAELSVFKFIEEEKPNFDVITLCPPAIYGPLRHSITNTNELNETTWRIYENYINSSKDAPLPPDRVFMYVDVRDIAAAHVLAATTPNAGNERIIVTAAAASSQRIADILRENFPELERRTPAGKPGTNSLPENHFTISNEKSMKILGLKYREEEDTFVDMVRQILEIEKRQKGD